MRTGIEGLSFGNHQFDVDPPQSEADLVAQPSAG